MKEGKPSVMKGGELLDKNNQPINGVKCVVDTCYYWHQGNQCKASTIEVKPPGAKDAEETDCATFYPTNS